MPSLPSWRPAFLFLVLGAAAAASTTSAAQRDYRLAFQKSVVSQGDERLLHNVYAKLFAGECINVLAVGGSVTCAASRDVDGHPGFTFPDAARKNLSYAWPALLLVQLDTHYPCPAPGHVVRNICHGGMTSDTWGDHFSGRDRFAGRWDGRGMNGTDGRITDLIIVDTSVNDVEELVKGAARKGIDAMQAIRKATEALMLLFMHNVSGSGGSTGAGAAGQAADEAKGGNVSSGVSGVSTSSWTGIACIWLGTSMRGHGWEGEWPRQGDAVHIHLPLAQYHGVPYVSVIDGFGPFLTHESRQWFLNVYRGDACCHVSIQGHMLLADLLFDYLDTRFEDWRQLDSARPWPYAGSGRRAPYELRRPLLLSAWEVVLLTGSAPLRMNLQAELPAVPYLPVNTSEVPCTHFSFGDDGHHKPGLLAYEVGANCSFFVPKSKVRKHATFWQLHVRTLKSYNLMGTLNVQVSAVDCDAEAAHPELLGSMRVDCLWERRSSQSDVDRLDLKRPTNPSACLLITYTVVPGLNATSNKIKVFEMQLF